MFFCVLTLLLKVFWYYSRVTPIWCKVFKLKAYNENDSTQKTWIKLKHT